MWSPTNPPPAELPDSIVSIVSLPFMAEDRQRPNIIITGTPGTGKSTHAQALVEACPTLQHINIVELVKLKGLHEGYDEEWQTYVVDDDKVSPVYVFLVLPNCHLVINRRSLTSLSRWLMKAVLSLIGIPAMHTQNGGLTLLWYYSVTILSYGNASRSGKPCPAALHHLLMAEFSNYPLKKIQENNECEIMGTVVEEAREAYTQEIIVVLRSEEPEDVENNVARLVQWVENWKADRELS